MEENKEQEKSAIEKGGDKVKNFGKKKILKWMAPVISAIATFAGIFFLALLVVGLTMVIQKLIQDTILSIFDFQSNDSETSATATTEIQNIIEIDENSGAYKLKEEGLAKQIREKLEKQKVNNELLGFEIKNDSETSEGESTTQETLEEIEDMIDTYIKAEVQTTYPKTDVDLSLFSDNLDGIITIRRAYADTGKKDDLDYIKYSKFCAKVNSNDSSVLNNFSLNPEDFKLCIARKGNSGESAYVIEEFDYQKYVQNYSTPLNFFISLHLISQDVDFMNDVVDMVLGENKENPIELTYVEKIKTTTTTYNYSGQAEAEVEEGAEAGDANEEIKPPKEIDNDNVKDFYDAASSKKVELYHTGEWHVTNADTWLKSSGKTISNNTTTKQDSSATGEPKTVKDEGGILVTETITITKSTTTFKVTENDSEINVQEFVDLIKEYPNVEDNLTSAPSDLFYLLQQDERTQRLERIMRYVLYKLTDINYGVLDVELEKLLEDKTTDISKYAGTLVEKLWYAIRDAGYSEYATAGVMGNLWAESGPRTNNLENIFEIGGEYSLGYTDETYTEAVNNGTYSKEEFSTDHYLENCGAGYGIAQWTWHTRKAALYDLAQKNDEDIDSQNLQIEFLLSELPSFEEPIIEGEDWVNAESPEDAAKAFCHRFESIGIKNTKRREDKAREYYEAFSGKIKQKNILVVAQEVHDAQTDWISYTDHELGKDSLIWGNIQQSLKNPNKTVSGATYVSLVIYKAGLLIDGEMNSFNYNSPDYLSMKLNSAGWEKIENIDDLKAGDIVFINEDLVSSPEKVMIYAGDNEWYSANDTNDIQSEAPSKKENWEKECINWWAYRSPRMGYKGEYPEGIRLIDNGIHIFPEYPQVSAVGEYAKNYLHVHYGGSAGYGPDGAKTLVSSGCGTFSMSCIVSGLLDDATVEPISYVENLDDSGMIYYSYGSGSNLNICKNSFLEKYYGVHSRRSNNPYTNGLMTDDEMLEVFEELNGDCAALGGCYGHYIAIIPIMNDPEGYKFWVIDSAHGHTGKYKSGQDFRNRATCSQFWIFAVIYE